mgnify:CR=1 FL=1
MIQQQAEARYPLVGEHPITAKCDGPEDTYGVIIEAEMLQRRSDLRHFVTELRAALSEPTPHTDSMEDDLFSMIYRGRALADELEVLFGGKL